MTNKIKILDSFILPDEDELFEVVVSDSRGLTPNCWIWNESVGYLEVVKYSIYKLTITLKNLGRRENAKSGTEFPSCMEFLITAPSALDPYNPLSTCLAADFNSPAVGNEAYMSVSSTYVIKVDDQIIVDSDYRYSVTQVVNATTLKVKNEGLGKEGIIEVGCDSCVPVQVVSKLNCCPIPSGDLTSNTFVLSVNNGYDVLLDNASLTLDIDLSKYDNTTSEFITLSDIPRGTLSSVTSLIGVTGGASNVLGNISLLLDTDLSKYDNTTSGYITLGDVPRGTLSSDSSLITVLGGVNNVLDNIELDLDTDLSKYNNTNSQFLSSSDKKNLTSTTSVLSVTNGTGATLENASVTLDTDLSKYDNSTSEFLSETDKKNLTSNTVVLAVSNGSGATLENTSLTLDTDLSKYDNSNSQFVSLSGLPSGDINSNTSVLSVGGGTGATLSNVSLTLDTDLSKYDNSTSEFITDADLNNITARLDKIEDIMSWAFNFTIDTTKSSGTTFEFNYTYSDAYTIGTFSVDWGDGSVEPFTTAGSSVTMSHTYEEDGVYHISVYCDPYISYRFELYDYPSIAFNTTTAPMLISVDSPYYGLDCASMFSGCTNLATIPANLFAYSGGDDFSHTFDTCSALTTIPADLFKYNTYATTFDHVFYKCTALTAIPEDLFRYNTDVTTFANAFDSCSALSSIPEDLFRYNTLVTNFSRVFSSCDALTEIPVDLFRYNTAATNFSYMFERCGSLITVPTDLFRYNTAATNFHYTFRYCTSLESVPPYLFRYNTAVTDFSGTFQHCTKLILNSDMFCDEATEMATRFAGMSSVTFSTCFSRGSYSGEQAGTAPELWNYTIQGGYWPSGNILSCFGGAGNNSTSLTNYANIPSGWK